MKISDDELPLNSYEINFNDDPTLETIVLTLYVSGCVRRCIGCHNPQLQEVDLSTLVPIQYIEKLILNMKPLIGSVCFCGGDFIPLYTNQLRKIIKICKLNNLRTILYTGELYENIDPDIRENLDIIIDGPYEQDKKNTHFSFPASSNQRVFIKGIQYPIDELAVNKKLKVGG